MPLPGNGRVHWVNAECRVDAIGGRHATLKANQLELRAYIPLGYDPLHSLYFTRRLTAFFRTSSVCLAACFAAESSGTSGV